ncbi:hypothetical protein [Pseudarthrobacter sp. NPDC080039]|uniref:hypothetical protein n=1 Tax=unclassified Pseudarthrobacter TaxID=2647000 RepID=UPI00344B6222
MSTNERNADPAAPELVAVTPDAQDPTGQDVTGLDPSATDPMADEKVRLQLAIFEVTRDADGKSLDDIQEMLRAAFARHRVATPPGTWLESVASSAYYGEPYIVDLSVAAIADTIVPAPNDEVRERLAARRQLQQEKLPAGIFPAPSDWNIPGSDAAVGSNRTTSPDRWKGSAVPAMAALAAVALAAVLVARAGTGRRRRLDT